MTMTLLGVGVVLQVLGMAVWLGGLFFLGAVAAPATFRAIPDRLMAGGVVGAMLRRLHMAEVLAALLVLAGCGMFYLAEADRTALAANTSLAMVMFLLVIVYGGWLAPQIERLLAARTAGQADDADAAANAVRFASLHRTHKTLCMVNLLLGIALIATLGWLVARSAVLVEEYDPTMLNTGFGGFGGF